MSYSNSKSVEAVAVERQVCVSVNSFVRPMPMPIDEYFRQELFSNFDLFDVRMSEAAIGEFMIAPVLKEIWKKHCASLLLWSHIALKVGDDYEGYPHYFFTNRSSLGLVRANPYLLVSRAERDNFENGWGNCLTAMLASQTINENDQIAMHGVVTNGTAWQFGKLQGRNFLRDPRTYVISSLDDLFAALNYVFTQAEELARQN